MKFIRVLLLSAIFCVTYLYGDDPDSVLVIFTNPGGAGGVLGTYIQNQSDSSQFANFRISGNGLIGGNVGIGTIAPNRTLEVFNNVLATNQLRLSGVGPNGIEFMDNDGSKGLNLFYRTSPDELRIEDSLGTIVLGVKRADGVTYFNSGNVGIGTTGPNSVLEVVASASFGNDALRLRANGTTKYIFAQYETTNDAGRIGSFDGTAGTLKNLYFDVNRIGIGTPTPQSKFEVTSAFGAGQLGDFIMSLKGGEFTESDLYVLNTRNVNPGVGYAAKVIGVNIQNAVGANNQVYVRSNTGGLTSAGAFYLGSDDYQQGIFGVLGVTGAPNAELNHLVTVKSNGYVGIGTTSPDVKLDVDGDIECDLISTGGGYVGYVAGGSNGGAYKLTRYSSSRRYKENITDFNLGLDVVKKMHPVEFNWKSNGDRDFGFIAEEADEINPLLITRINGEVESFKYMAYTAVLTNAIKEQQKIIEKLLKEMDELKTIIQKEK